MKLRSLLVVLALVACAGPTDVQDGDALLRTSARSYSLVSRDDKVEVDIPFTFDNRTGADVYLWTCTGAVPPSLERKDGNEWRTVWTDPGLICYHPPIKVSPGEVHAETLYVYAFLLGDNRKPQFPDLNVAGTYRLRWDRALSSWDIEGHTPPGQPIDLRYRVSNEFQLKGEYRAAPPPQPKLTYLDVKISRSLIAVGDTAKMTATGLDESYKPIAITDPINWSTSGVSIQSGLVDIFPGGTVVGVRPGQLTIKGSVGLATGQTTVEVVANPLLAR